MTSFKGEGDILEKLKAEAWERSEAFCYGDYRIVKPDANGRTFCPVCHSDDLMRHVSGVGVEYGIEWIVAHIIESEFDEVDNRQLGALTAEAIDAAYPEISIGGATFSASSILAELSPGDFDLWESDEADSLVDNGSHIELNGTLYEVPAQYL